MPHWTNFDQSGHTTQPTQTNHHHVVSARSTTATVGCLDIWFLTKKIIQNVKSKSQQKYWDFNEEEKIIFTPLKKPVLSAQKPKWAVSPRRVLE